MPKTAVEGFLGALGEIGIVLDTGAESGAVMDLARRHRLTAYDALYLELALRRALPLATLDRALGAAAEAEDVALIGA